MKNEEMDRIADSVQQGEYFHRRFARAILAAAMPAADIRPEWIHGIDKAIAKLAQYWRRDSGCAADLQEVKAYLEAQLAAAEPAALPEDQRAAVEFYAKNPSAALFDMNRRIATPIAAGAPAADALLNALKKAEAALSDIGDADREPGDDLAWCERRAAQDLPLIRAALKISQVVAVAPAAEQEPCRNQLQCTHPSRCAASGKCQRQSIAAATPAVDPMKTLPEIQEPWEAWQARVNLK